MNKEFLSYDQSVKLKELGFDEPCLKYWNGIGEHFDQKDWVNWNQAKKFVSIPLYQQVFRWFQDRYNLEGTVQQADDFNWYKWNIARMPSTPYPYTRVNNKQYIAFNALIPTRTEAEIDCIDNLIKIVKKIEDGKV